MIYGNFEDKYNSRNPIAKILVGYFIKTFKKLLNEVGNPQKIIEVGAGEGYLTNIVAQKFPECEIWASDLAKDILAVAPKILRGQNVHISVDDIENLSYPDNFFDLCICCEVLEHISNPKKALSEIKRVTKGKVIFSVPLEPLWRVLNMLRGKYLKDFGNTPGHINHWTQKNFVKLVEASNFKVLSSKFPLPWQMILAKRSNDE